MTSPPFQGWGLRNLPWLPSAPRAGVRTQSSTLVFPAPQTGGFSPLEADKEISTSGICILPFQIPQIPHRKFSWLPDSQGGGGLGEAALGQPGAINGWLSDRETTLGVDGNSHTRNLPETAHCQNQTSPDNGGLVLTSPGVQGPAHPGTHPPILARPP